MKKTFANSLFQNPISVFESLPTLLKNGCHNFSNQRERDVFLTAALGVLSGCLPGIHGKYDHRKLFPNLYTFIIAPAASGKDELLFARELGQHYHQQLVSKSKAALSKHKKEMKYYKSELKKYYRGKLAEIPKKPNCPLFQTLYIPVNSHSDKLIQQLYNNKNGGILFDAQADTTDKILRQDKVGYSMVMSKAFHHQPISYYGKFDHQYIEVNKPRLSVVLSGTLSQVNTLVPSAESELFSRFLFYVSDQDSREVSPKGRMPQLLAFFRQASKEITEAAHFLSAHPTSFHLTKTQWKKLNTVFRGLFKDTIQSSGSGAKSIIIELGGILFRISMIFSALRKAEEKNPSPTIYCNDQDFETALTLIKTYRAHALFVYNKISNKHWSLFPFKNVRKRALYDALPLRFQRKDILHIANRLNIPERSLNRYLKDLLEKGYLVRASNGLMGSYIKELVANSV